MRATLGCHTPQRLKRNALLLVFAVLAVLTSAVGPVFAADSYFPCPVLIKGNFSDVERLGKRRWGYIDSRANIVIKPQFIEAETFHDGLALVYIKGKYGYIGLNGILMIQAKYDDAKRFSEMT